MSFSPNNTMRKTWKINEDIDVVQDFDDYN